MQRLFGMDTEYGFTVEGVEPGDLIREATALVESYPGKTGKPWDYRREDPRADQRGFRVKHLTTNPDDAQYDKPTSGTPPTQEQVRADRVLVNGARFYNDHGHPEYATPECAGIRDLVAYEKAGERILLESAHARSKQTGKAVSIYKNNTDYHGISYGTHEDYLMRRDAPWQNVFNALMPFFVTRQIFAGAGKIGIEPRQNWASGGVYQLAQRSDFFMEEASVDTLHRRPIVNTRDEPHADPNKYRRLHVIVGDSNMSEWATALKIGTTLLVIELIEQGWQPAFGIRNPVDTIKAISRDPSLTWNLTLSDGRQATALDVQRSYLANAYERFAGKNDEYDWILGEWQDILDDLEAGYEQTADRIDWAAKRHLLETYIEEEGLNWNDENLPSLDLAYHDIDPENSLYYALEQGGSIRRVVDEAMVEAATVCPPLNTRAAIRGIAVEKFQNEIVAISWSRLVLRDGEHTRTLDLTNLVDRDLTTLAPRLQAAASVAEFVDAVRAFGHTK